MSKTHLFMTLRESNLSRLTTAVRHIRVFHECQPLKNVERRSFDELAWSCQRETHEGNYHRTHNLLHWPRPGLHTTHSPQEGLPAF